MRLAGGRRDDNAGGSNEDSRGLFVTLDGRGNRVG